MLLRGLLRNCGGAGAAIVSPAWHSSYKAAAATAGAAVADRGMRIASAPHPPAPTPTPSSAHVTADGGPAIEGIPLAEYAARRRQLMGMLPPNSVAVIPAAPTVYMSNDIPYRFRQESNFRYLCGFHEPDAVLVLLSASKGSEPVASIAVLPRDPAREKWDGPRTGMDAAPKLLGVDTAVELKELSELVSAAASVAERAFYETTQPTHPQHHATITPALSAAGHDDTTGQHVATLKPMLHKMRAVKSPAEIKVMGDACRISSEAMVDAMSASSPGVSEHLLDATLEYGMRARGGKFHAYPPVVAGGARANTLHYVANDKHVLSGEMVLIDAGTEYRGYAGDISRTWPVNGRYSDAQREVYEAVLRVQTECIAMCRPGASFAELHRASEVATARELADLGLCDVDDRRELKRFYPHSIGHHLGLDVHDVQSIPHFQKFEEGMVVTVEPGIYIPDSPDIPSRFRGIGIRIEDDVAITKDGYNVLTADCPKTVADVETAVRG